MWKGPPIGHAAHTDEQAPHLVLGSAGSPVGGTPTGPVVPPAALGLQTAVSPALAAGGACSLPRSRLQYGNHAQQQAKSTATREKNVQAQQRSRAKQRAQQAEEEAAAQAAIEDVAGELEALRLENRQLKFTADLLEKTLAVRQAVLTLCQSLQVVPEVLPGSGGTESAGVGSVSEAQGTDEGAAAIAGQCQQVMAAMQRLPSTEVMGRVAAELPGTCSGPAGSSRPQQPARPAPLGGAAAPAAALMDAAAALSRGAGDGSAREQDLPGSATAAAGAAPTAPPAPAVVAATPRAAAEVAADAVEIVPAPTRRPLCPRSYPDDGWGPPGVALGLGGSSGVLAQVVVAAYTQHEFCGGPGGSGGSGQHLRLAGVPPPDNVGVRLRLERIHNIDGLSRIIKRMQAQLRSEWAAAEAAQQWVPGTPARQALEHTLADMTQLFWHTAQLKPRLFNLFLLAALPSAEQDMAGTWHNIAVDSLPMLSEAEIEQLHAAYHAYAKRTTLAAACARPFVERVQALEGTDPTCPLPNAAQRHMEVAELASRMHRACQEQYLAAMAFLASMAEHANPLVRCFWHVACPVGHMPDHPAIISAILRLHKEQADLLAAPASSSGGTCASA